MGLRAALARIFHRFPPAWWAVVERPKAADALPAATEEARRVRERAERALRTRRYPGKDTLADVLASSPPPWVERAEVRGWPEETP